MRVPEPIRKNVVFLGRRLQKGNEEEVRFVGTGFFVMVPSRFPDRGYLYLVTARHVVDILTLGDWVMRVNTRTGGCVDFWGNKDHKWWFHPTEEDRTDVAVTTIKATEELDFRALPLSIFVADEDMKSETGIGPGDEVFLTGLFNRMRGRSRNMPIVRMGNVAMIPDPGELVPGVRIGRSRVVDAEAYLIEARSMGGVSGSPVFVRRTVSQFDPVSTRGGQPKVTHCLVYGEFFLLGLMNGHWDIDPMEKNDPDPVLGRRDGSVNLGIAVVVPSNKIRESLYHPELVALREQQESVYAASQGTTTPD
jgi:hypothetical protein